MTKALVFNRTIYLPLVSRNLTIALPISVSFHLVLIAIYYIVSSFSIEEQIVTIRLTKYIDLPPPPSIDQVNNTPIVNVNTPTTMGKGIPVPVPDADVNPEQTIASQIDLARLTGPTDDILNSKSQVEFIADEIIIEEESSLDAFIPVEKQPVPITQVAPSYPIIAQRTNIEGTVWVKILIDKNGKAKKAIVIKSDAEIFNEAAIQAALQWVFTPAMMNNGPVQVWAAVPFKFKLNK
jgi:TonB family protein